MNKPNGMPALSKREQPIRFRRICLEIIGVPVPGSWDIYNLVSEDLRDAGTSVTRTDS